MSNLKTLISVVLGTSIALASSLASAGLITSQAQLSSILGAGETLENFEGNGMLGGGQIYYNGGSLNSTSTFGGYGPGLVMAGATYSAPNMWWNDNGYYGLNTRTLGDSSAWRNSGITITYTNTVTAFGFDLQGYQGYSQVGVVEVYDSANMLISSINVNGGFVGWESSTGIDHVKVLAGNDGYIMIDNHGFGAASAVPVPAAAWLLGSGLLGLVGVARRKTA